MQHYKSKYPRSGRIAILCEGDLAGYEADLIESWTVQFPDLGLVDVWPCGTKSAIYGMSDAIGRAIRIHVIEDRDHRTKEVAEKDCRGKLKDRRERGVKIGFWKSWNRHEIENYLVEPAIVRPVFSEVFDTPEDKVSESLQEVLTKTAIDQALQLALSEFRSAFPNEKSVGGVSRKEARPRWGENGLVVPDPNTVKDDLTRVFVQSLQSLQPDRQPEMDRYLERFVRKSEEWLEMKVNDKGWRIDWAGKEVLAWLRVKMASEAGWPDVKDHAHRTPIEWEKMSPKEYSEQDRLIERAIQPRLVKALLRKLTSNATDMPEIVEEWNGLITALSSELPDSVDG
jgi:hypothetical protein